MLGLLVVVYVMCLCSKILMHMNVIVFVFAFATNPLQVHASFVHEVHDQVDSAVGMVWYAIALILRVDVSCWRLAPTSF